MAPSGFTGVAPPPKGTKAYQEWLQAKSNRPIDQPLGEIDHNAWIASQFPDGINTHEQSREAKRAKKTARNRKARAVKRGEGEEVAERARVVTEAQLSIMQAQAAMEKEEKEKREAKRAQQKKAQEKRAKQAAPVVEQKNFEDVEEAAEPAAEGEVYKSAGQGGDEEDEFRFDWEDEEEVGEVEGSGELILENPDDDEE